MLNDGRETSGTIDPPFSPVLLAGLALAPLPVSALQPIFSALLTAIRGRHPDILERLSDFPQAVIGIDPVDLPFILLLTTDPDAPKLLVRRSFSGEKPTAVIRGSLEMLLGLAEGRLDGDAAFFNRRLSIEGDTEVIVALRNAIDAADIALEDDLLAAMGPLGRPLRPLADVAKRGCRRFWRDLGILHDALMSPVRRASEAQTARLADLEHEVEELRHELAKKGVRL